MDEHEHEAQAPERVDVAPDPDRTGIQVEKPPRSEELTEDELEEVRRKRLDPENRPENAEVDNTQRTFDTTTGTFEDAEAEPGTGPYA